MRKPNLNIIYEDSEIIVVQKPAGLAVQTANMRQKDLLSELKNYRTSKKEEPYIGLIHRLDQPVEGVMVFAKTKAAASNLSKQVQGRSVEKEYRATVCGHVEPEQGELLDVLLRDGRTNTSRVVLAGKLSEHPEHIDKEAKNARLEYQVLSYEEQLNRTQVKIQLDTGRHHQIRVQFSSRGWPLVGDAKYGKPEPGERKLLLCSCKIAFLHPKTKQAMVFEI